MSSKNATGKRRQRKHVEGLYKSNVAGDFALSHRMPRMMLRYIKTDSVYLRNIGR